MKEVRKQDCRPMVRQREEFSTAGGFVMGRWKGSVYSVDALYLSIPMFVWDDPTAQWIMLDTTKLDHWGGMKAKDELLGWMFWTHPWPKRQFLQVRARLMPVLRDRGYSAFVQARLEGVI